MRLVFVLFAVCWAVSVLAQPQVSKGDGIKSKQEAEKSIETEKDAHYKSPSALPSSATVPPILTQSTVKKSEGETQQGGDNSSEFWPTFAGYRLKVTDTLVAIFTALLFFATLALWWSTRRLVRGAERTAERQLRAYVFPDEVIVSGFDTPSPTIRVSFKNSGQTPAYKVEFLASSAVMQRPLSEGPDPLKRKGEEGGFLGCQAANHSHVIPKDISANERIALNSGSAALFLFGGINYVDAFGKDRFTKFCYYAEKRKKTGNGDGPMAIFERWNDAN